MSRSFGVQYWSRIPHCAQSDRRTDLLLRCGKKKKYLKSKITLSAQQLMANDALRKCITTR